jgi:hypothetical protein
MDKGPLVTDEIEAGAAFLTQLNAHWPVRAACWLREDEDEERYLYAALDGLTPKNSGAAYDEVLQISQTMKDHYIDPFRVKLIDVNHRVAKAVLEIYRRYPGRVPPRLNGRVFAGTAVTEEYVYPPFSGKP